MKQLIVFYLISCCSYSYSQQGRDYQVVLNGKVVIKKQLNLINPKNINAINIDRVADTARYEISTKKKVFLNYSDIKQNLRVPDDSKPIVIIDTKDYGNLNNLLIDQTFIRKIKYEEEKIIIKTISYKQRLKEKDKPSVMIRTYY